MLLRLCQLKSLILTLMILTSGCTNFRRESGPGAYELLSPFSHKWFAQNPDHALYDQEGNPQPHAFFDVVPELSKNQRFINAVVTTPEGSEHSYQIDLLSGQRHYDHSYCPQQDVWNNYKGSIEKPKFTLGIVPRMMDQIGELQKIIIFGGQKKFSELNDGHLHRVKLVGAVVEKICPEGNCLGKSNWLSHVVLLAVDPYDKKFSSLEDIADLKASVDWEEMKAIMENIDGRNTIASLKYPAVKIGQLIPLQEALDYLKRNSVYISNQESDKIQKGCHALYNRLWEEVGQVRPEDLGTKTDAEFKAKKKLEKDLRKQKKPVGFAERLAVFTKKYYQEFTTCEKFVYHGNINRDPEAFWFLSQLGLFFRLHKEGYYFDCNRRSWHENVITAFGKPVHDLPRDINLCDERDIDTAMEFLPNFLTGLKGSASHYYKFIDYDTHSFGTHRKMYSWVKVSSKKYDCSRDPNEKIRSEIKVFPEDVSWKPRHAQDIDEETKNIY